MGPLSTVASGSWCPLQARARRPGLPHVPSSLTPAKVGGSRLTDPRQGLRGRHFPLTLPPGLPRVKQVLLAQAEAEKIRRWEAGGSH